MAKTFNRMRFGAAVRTHRENAGLSQAEASDASGVGQSQFTPIERGHVTPTLDSVGKLCDWMGRDMADFWDEVPDVLPVLID